jgi:ABC-type oligopeptide transport system substrate-binding subunit
VEQARKLFAEALQELGITKEQLPPIVLSYNSSEYHQRTSQIAQEQWEKAFDIRVVLQQEEWKVHYQNLVKGNFQIGGMGWHSWLRDPISCRHSASARMVSTCLAGRIQSIKLFSRHKWSG